MSNLPDSDPTFLSTQYLSTNVFIEFEDLFGAHKLVLSPLDYLSDFTLSKIPDNSPLVNDCWVITAQNPFSEGLDQTANDLRNESLMADLQAYDLGFSKAIARAIDDSWEEQSFAVWKQQRNGKAISRNLVIALAGKYSQNAIFEYTAGTMTIIPVLNIEVSGSAAYYTHSEKEA